MDEDSFSVRIERFMVLNITRVWKKVYKWIFKEV